MNISYRWLQELVPELADPAERVASRLAMYGAPVEELVRLGEFLSEIVIARVAAVRPHPNADRLSLCTVDAGAGEPLQVVCGAPNVRAGAFYPFAPVGAMLPGDLVIRKAKIRGEESRGMLCSERELGLGRDHAGLMELHGRWHPGEPFLDALGLDDVRLVVEVTANRPDLLSHIGIARELAPGGRLELPALPGAAQEASREPSFAVERLTGETGGVTVTIEDAGGCPRYLGAVIRGVTIGSSPAWLAARLRAVGLRPINNVVDATNYILYELGQPLHAFDLRWLGGPAVRIRRARSNEELVTLDGISRSLSPDMLVIADEQRAVAVAGVMGGEDSEVRADTTDIFLECALFEPKTVRRTRTALGLSTDASYRFERGVDPEGGPRALSRAVALIVAVAGGKVDEPVLDLQPHAHVAPVVAVRPSRVSRVLGSPFTGRQILAYLQPLGFELLESARTDEAEEEERLWLRVPGPRAYDVSREIDLVEEVARRHGYDAFPQQLAAFRPSSVPEDRLSRLEDRIRAFLVGVGYLEARGAAFAPESGGDVALLNPLSSAESRLRRDLLPGLVARLEHNFARGTRNVRLFEIGTVFHATPDRAGLPLERNRLALIFTGARHSPHWSERVQPFDIWDLKGLLERLAPLVGSDLVLEVAHNEQRHGDADLFERGQSLVLTDDHGRTVARGGKLRPGVVDSPAWADDVFGVEVELVASEPAARQRVFRTLPAFPGIERDLALLVPDPVPAGEVEGQIRVAAGALLESVSPFDLYAGKGIPGGVRSIAFRLRFRAKDRTLKDAEADEAVARVLRALKEVLGVERRG